MLLKVCAAELVKPLQGTFRSMLTTAPSLDASGVTRTRRAGEGRFVAWCHLNHLQLNTSKTKELIIDYRTSKPGPQPAQTAGNDIEVVGNCCWAIN